MNLIHIFWDTDMRSRHEGLAERARKERKFKVEDLEPGDMLVFVNRARTKVMALAGVAEADSFGVLGYYRSPHGRIDELAVGKLAGAFSGGKIDMDKATKEALLERLQRKKARAK